MDPTLQHRLLLLACIAAACAILAPFAPDFLPADRVTGLSLVFAHTGGLHAFFQFALLLLPITLLALIASISGSVLSGLFVLGASLAIFAAGFGPADGLLLRANLPNDYKLLLLETAGLGALFLLAGAFLFFATPILKAAIPRFARLSDPQAESDRPTLAANLKSLLVTAAVAGILTYILAVGTSPKQTIGALVTAFALASIASHLLVGKPGTLGTLLAPIPLALLAYAYPLLAHLSPHTLTHNWFSGELPSLCKILPIYYLAASPLGSIVGYVLSHAPTNQDAPDPGSEPLDTRA